MVKGVKSITTPSVTLPSVGGFHGHKVQGYPQQPPLPTQPDASPQKPKSVLLQVAELPRLGFRLKWIRSLALPPRTSRACGDIASPSPWFVVCDAKELSWVPCPLCHLRFVVLQSGPAGFSLLSHSMGRLQGKGEP